jgi:hypothetical protein
MYLYNIHNSTISEFYKYCMYLYYNNRAKRKKAIWIAFNFIVKNGIY